MLASITKIGGNNLLSRILGFTRDLVIARIFGADAATDAFFVAFKIPNFARRLFAEGVFSMALVPVLTEHKARGTPALKSFVDELAGALGVMLLLTTAVGVLAAPALVLLFAPGFVSDASQFEMATAMLRLTFPYVLFVTLTAFAGGILNTHERFGVPAFTPVILNLSLIACAIWLAPRFDAPILALAWGVLIAGIAQLAFQLPFLQQLGLLPRPRLNLADPGIRRLIMLMGPAILGVSVGQISLLLDTLLASFLQTGSISWLYYSDRLMEFPLGILAVALGTVIMPELSSQHLGRATADFSRTLDWALRWVLLLGAPAAIGLLALSRPLMATLFYSGEFASRDVQMAAWSLMAYAPGVAAFMAIKVLAPGYYARQDIGRPVRFAIIALGVGLACNLLLMLPMGHAGLALATSMAAALNAGLLLRGLLVQGIYRPEPGWRPLLIKGLAASAAMGALLLTGTGTAASWIAMGTGERILALGGWILAGAAVYAGILIALRVKSEDLRRRSA
nr:murein biosynthesis integral membrane protein MurJ [Thiocystis violacea]